jgi:hypothetical protein
MTTRWARFVRGWVAAAISVFVALCSHTLAGGAVPSVAGIALCLAFSGMVCIALAGKSLSLPRLAISVLLSQFLFHGAFSLLGSAVPTTPTPATHSMSELMSAPAVHITPLVDSGMSMPAWMWAAHGVAAIVTIVALRFGERTFWQLLALTRPTVRRLLALMAIAVTPAEPARPIETELLPRPRLVVVSWTRRRGPPAFAA